MLTQVMAKKLLDFEMLAKHSTVKSKRTYSHAFCGDKVLRKINLRMVFNIEKKLLIFCYVCDYIQSR